MEWPSMNYKLIEDVYLGIPSSYFSNIIYR
ncbi:hypothetical protein AEQU3_00508 [Aequorivita antarctica]|nr:hypothetical protein AEQU3_00508 [Aequorivita antarctica]